MIRTRTARLTAGIVLAVATLVTPLAALAGTAAASTPPPNSPQQVASGINVASLPGVTAFPALPADHAQETVSFVLRERNIFALETDVQFGLRNYLSVSQFAST